MDTLLIHCRLYCTIIWLLGLHVHCKYTAGTLLLHGRYTEGTLQNGGSVHAVYFQRTLQLHWNYTAHTLHFGLGILAHNIYSMVHVWHTHQSVYITQTLGHMRIHYISFITSTLHILHGGCVTHTSHIHCIYFVDHMCHISTDVPVYTTHKSLFMRIHHIYIMAYTCTCSLCTIEDVSRIWGAAQYDPSCVHEYSYLTSPSVSSHIQDHILWIYIAVCSERPKAGQLTNRLAQDCRRKEQQSI